MSLVEDPLSQLLDVVDAHAAMSTGLVAQGRWAIDVLPTRALKCNIVKEGRCLLQIGDQQWELGAGDCFLVGPNLAFVIASERGVLPRPAADIFGGSAKRTYAQLLSGAGPIFRCLSGRLMLSGIAFLREALPPVVIIRAGHQAAGRLRWLVETLEEELLSDTPGAAAMAKQIMQIIFIEVLRNAPYGPIGHWLAALSDPKIGMALRAIHQDPGRNWRLADLATISHLSRAQFSARFRSSLGRAPMEYVRHWRMALAQKALKDPGSAIATVAAQAGYSSQSSFTYAFQRTMGTTPLRTRRGV